MSALRPMDVDRRLGIRAAVLILASVMGAVTLAPESLAMPITAAELRLTPCEQKTREGEATADCGTLVVPENRAMPQARMISLPVIRIRATGRNPGEPLFWLEGGPGRTNVGFQPPACVWRIADFCGKSVIRYTHGGLGNAETEHQKFTMDPRCTPEKVLTGHPYDQMTDFAGNPRTPAAPATACSISPKR